MCSPPINLIASSLHIQMRFIASHSNAQAEHSTKTKVQSVGGERVNTLYKRPFDEATNYTNVHFIRQESIQTSICDLIQMDVCIQHESSNGSTVYQRPLEGVDISPTPLNFKDTFFKTLNP
jgi:hypothetical protein